MGPSRHTDGLGRGERRVQRALHPCLCSSAGRPPIPQGSCRVLGHSLGERTSCGGPWPSQVDRRGSPPGMSHIQGGLGRRGQMEDSFRSGSICSRPTAQAAPTELRAHKPSRVPSIDGSEMESQGGGRGPIPGRRGGACVAPSTLEAALAPQAPWALPHTPTPVLSVES